jgi:hypothetical protein
MWEYDREEQSRTRECQEAYQFRQLATEAILAHLTETTTPEQYDQAVLSVQALAADYNSRLDAFHRSPLYGRHRCIAAACRELETRITNARLLAPVPQPQQPPTPPPPAPLTTPRHVVEELRETLRPQPDATPLGIDDELPDIESGR